MLLNYLIIIEITSGYIVTVAGTTLYGFTVNDAKGSTASIKKYFIIKNTLFTLKKKFATSNYRRKYNYIIK